MTRDTEDDVELIYNESGVLNDNTFPSDSEESRSSTSTDDDAQEAAAVERGGMSKRQRRRLEQRRKNAEEEAIRRKRRPIIMALSVIPLVVATIALALVMVSKNGENDKVYATAGAASAPYQADATTAAREAATVPFKSDAPATYGPTSSAPSPSVPVTTNQPSPHPMSAVDPLASASGETHSGLRSTKSPTTSPAGAAGSHSSPYSTDLVLPSNPVTSNPTTGAPTDRPTTGPPTTAPTEYCVGAGVACPDKKEAKCCSDICLRSKETGEKVCAPTSGKIGDVLDSVAEDEEEDRPLTCASAGSECPKDKEECCSGRCSRGKEKVCLL